MAVKAVLVREGLWSQYLEVGIGPDAEIFTKAQPMSAVGLGADIAASDTWPGGGPVGEDQGFNGIIVRTLRGLELYQAAVAAGALTIERALCFRDFDVFQPHQVRKRRSVWARLKGMAIAGKPV